MEDITKTGIKGLKGLKGLNYEKDKKNKEEEEYNSLIEEFQNPSPTVEDYSRSSQYSPSEFLINTGQNFGSSIYDSESISSEDIANVSNYRGKQQPWYAQLASGVTKGAILTGTTFLDGTIGLVTGIGSALSRGEMSGLWDNDFSKALQEVNEWSEEYLPNYYTDFEREGPWYENIFTANFIGDKFIKNLGFTVGAFYSGKLGAGILQGARAAALNSATKFGKAARAFDYGTSKLAETIGIVKKASQAPTMVTSGIGATISAVNEGRIEALNNSKEWFELQKMQIEDEYRKRLELIEESNIDNDTYNNLIEQENLEYNNALSRITEDRLKMGNMDMLLNLPILLSSNIIQFGKLYANGFKTARRTTNIVNKAGKFATTKTTGKGIARALLNPLSEGMEEISQKAASVISGNFYANDPNNFYKAKLDPKTEREFTNWLQEAAKGINETVNDGSSWEEFFIGTLTGGLGMPKFRSFKNSEGKIQSPVTLEGGVVGEFKDYKEAKQREESIVNHMNERVQSPEFINYYRGMIRHNKYQNDMNQAALDDNAFDYKNAEHAQLISDVLMFNNAGKIKDLLTLIDTAFDVSDENLKSIVENTSTSEIDSSGETIAIGPFTDKKGNPMYSTEDGKKEMIEKLTTTKDEIHKTVENYINISEELDTIYGDNLSDDQLEELSWLKSQIGNWKVRAEQLSEEIKSPIGTLITALDELDRVPTESMNTEGMNNAGITKLYEELFETAEISKKVKELFSDLKDTNTSLIPLILASNPKNVEMLKKYMDLFSKDAYYSKNFSDINTDTFNKKLDDIVKLVEASNSFSIKLKEYLENPSKLQEDINISTEEIATQDKKSKIDTIKDSIRKATTLKELRDILNSIEDSETKEEVIEQLSDEGNELIKNYKEVESYNLKVRNAINKTIDNSSAEGISEETKDNAIIIFDKMYQTANKLADISNPNSKYLATNELFMDEISDITEYTKAVYVVTNAMNIVKGDDKKIDLMDFVPEVDKGSTPPVSSDTTGADATTTIPTSTIPTTTPQDYIPITSDTTDVDATSTQNSTPITNDEVIDAPIGDISLQELINENKKLNNLEDSKSSGANFDDIKSYYKPEISYFHILKSKEGDFRKFNEVMKDENRDYDIIFNYFEDAGAFDYVDKGGLKKEDIIEFLIDPELEESMKEGFSTYKGPTILMATKEGQIVGSLSEANAYKFEGLTELRKKIVEEYNKHLESVNTSSEDNNTTINPYPSRQRKFAIENTTGKSVKRYTKEDVEILKIINENSSEFLEEMKEEVKNGTYYTDLLADYITLLWDRKIENGKLVEGTDTDNLERWLGLLEVEKINKDSDEVSIQFWEPDYYTKDTLNHTYAYFIAGDKITIKNGNRESVDAIVTKTDNNGDVLQVVEPSTNSLLVDNGEVFDTPHDIMTVNSESLIEFNDFNTTRYNKETVEKIKEDFEDVLNEINEKYTAGNDEKAKELVSELEKNLPLGFKTSTNDNNIVEIIPYVLLSIRAEELSELQTIYKIGDTIRVQLSDSVRKDFIVTQVDKDGKIVEAFSQDDYDNLSIIKDGKIIDKEEYFNSLNNTSSVSKESTINDSKKDKFKATPKTKVSQMMVGKIPYIKEEHSLSEIFPNITNGNMPIFGIMKNGKMETNGALNNSEITNLRHIANKDGRLYLLLPNVKGEYSPWYVRVKHLNNKEININDIIKADESNPLFYNLKKALNTLREAYIEDNLKSALADLKNVLYLKNIHFNSIVIDNVPYLQIKKAEIDKEGKEIPNKGIVKNISRENEAQFLEDILNALIEFNPSFQVNINSLNNNDISYNKNLIKAGILTSNITEAKIKGNWFTTDYFNANSDLQTAKNIPNRVLPTQQSNTSPVGGTESVIPGTPVTSKISGHTLYVDYKNKRIYNNKGEEISVNINNIKAFDVAYANDTFGDSKEGINLENNMLTFAASFTVNNVSLPAGRVLNRTTQEYIYPSENKYLSNSESFDKLLAFSNNKDENKDSSNQDSSNQESNNVGDINSNMQEINDVNLDYEDDLHLREAKEEFNVWNKEKEKAWLDKVLPKVSEEDRLKITKGLINVAEKGTKAWGQFTKGIITLSDIAAEGTLYHEAFHLVFNTLLTEEEKVQLLEEAKDLYGNKKDILLEEDMAEAFREYTMTREDRSLGRKILDFFKNLFAKVFYWKKIQLHTTALYQAINEGKYKNENFNEFEGTRNKQEEYTEEMKDILKNAPRNSEGKLLAPNKKVLSNLDKRQWVHVRTKAFKEWFGDWERLEELKRIENPTEQDLKELEKLEPTVSKVIDENGEPLVVYHGTPNGFIEGFKHRKELELGAGGRGTGTEGFYYTTNKSYAERYTYTDLKRGEKGKNPKVLEFFLNVKNLGEFNIENFPNFSVTSFYSMNSEDLKAFKNLGYDGLNLGNILNNSKNKRPEIVIFNSKQVKSATDNIGTYSNENDYTRYREVEREKEELFWDKLSKEDVEFLTKKGWTQDAFDNKVSQEIREQAVKCSIL